MICNNCGPQQVFVTADKEVFADQDSIIVYPNPFEEKLSIEITCYDPEEVKGL